MKLKRKSKIKLWFAESRRERATLMRDLASEEMQEWLKEWRTDAEGRKERVRQLIENLEPISKALKDTYPDNAPPAPLGVPMKSVPPTRKP
jgi:hypothetical protein